MAGFCYFIPNVVSYNAKLRDAVGLRHAFEDKSATFTTMTGPDGLGGCRWYHGKDQELFGKANKDRIEWRPCPKDAPKFWLGWERGKRPKPEDLRRLDRQGGENYAHPELGWAIPSQKVLPRVLDLDDATMEWCSRVAPEHRELAETTAELFDLYCSGKDLVQELGHHKIVSVCVEALGLLYRVGPFEMAVLGMDEQLSSMVIYGLMDIPEILGGDGEALARKKKELFELAGLCVAEMEAKQRAAGAFGGGRVTEI